MAINTFTKLQTKRTFTYKQRNCVHFTPNEILITDISSHLCNFYITERRTYLNINKLQSSLHAYIQAGTFTIRWPAELGTVQVLKAHDGQEMVKAVETAHNADR